MNGRDEQLLVPGVENLQVVYGVDTDGDLSPDIYKDIDDVTNVYSIVSIKVGLLVSSDKSALDTKPAGPVTFTLFGKNITAPVADMRFRRTFVSTILLRNVVL